MQVQLGGPESDVFFGFLSDTHIGSPTTARDFDFAEVRRRRARSNPDRRMTELVVSCLRGVHAKMPRSKTRALVLGQAAIHSHASVPLRASSQSNPVAKMPEGAVATGEQDDLHPRCGLRQDLGHEI